MFDIIPFALLLSVILILEAKHTIYSLIGLITVFICGASVFILVGSKFIGLIFIIVYIGAVGMFFLFMTMLLNPKTSEKSTVSILDLFLLVLTCLFMLQYSNVDDILTDTFFNPLWVEKSFLNSELSSISIILYDVRGLSLLVLGVLLFKAIIIAIDIAKTRP